MKKSPNKKAWTMYQKRGYAKAKSNARQNRIRNSLQTMAKLYGGTK